MKLEISNKELFEIVRKHIRDTLGVETKVEFIYGGVPLDLSHGTLSAEATIKGSFKTTSLEPADLKDL